ncbi:MAG: sigma factor [Alphaproteobacteria bacterium]
MEAVPPSPQDGSFESLMVRVQDGDARAYKRLLESVVPLLRSLSLRALRHPHDVEDAVQDILLTLHRVRHTYEPGRPFLPWLIAISRRRIIDRQRQAGRERRREAAFAAEAETFRSPAANNPVVFDDSDLMAWPTLTPTGGARSSSSQTARALAQGFRLERRLHATALKVTCIAR